MNQHVASFLIASGLALGISPAANAEPMERPGSLQAQSFQAQSHDMRGGGPQRWMRRLDLTEAQRDQIFKIFHDQAPAMREQAKVVRSTRQELRQAALSPSFDRARARQLADAQAKALSEMTFLRADSMSRVVALLTPEQRTKLQQMRERGQQRRGRG